MMQTRAPGQQARTQRPPRHPRSGSITLTGRGAAVALFAACFSGLLIAAWTGWGLLADVLFVMWVPLYLRGVKGEESVSAGWMAALPLVGGALGGVVSGWLMDWFGTTGGRRSAASSLCSESAGWLTGTQAKAIAPPIAPRVPPPR